MMRVIMSHRRATSISNSSSKRLKVFLLRRPRLFSQMYNSDKMTKKFGLCCTARARASRACFPQKATRANFFSHLRLKKVTASPFSAGLRRFVSIEGSHAKNAAASSWYHNSYATTSVVVAGLLGVSSYLAYNFTGWVMSFNPRYWVYLGFLSGFVVGAMFLGATGYMWRNITILPENIFRQSLQVLNSNSYIQQTLGHIKPSQMKVYHIENGFIGFKEKSFRWFSPNVQMMFRVNENTNSPVFAYVDADRTFAGLRLRNVCLLSKDVTHGYMEPQIVQVLGTDADINERSHLRHNLLSSKQIFLEAIPIQHINDV